MTTDEIDAIAGGRGPGGFGSNDEREQTLGRLLSDSEGVEPDASVVMAATNRLGGQASEVHVLGEPSTGASNDLASATELATRMVREWGFWTEVGPIGYGPEGPSRDNPFAGRPDVEQTQRIIDEEVARLLREAEIRATRLLDEHRDLFDRVVDLLLERETIDGRELAAIAGVPERRVDRERTWAPRVVALAPRQPRRRRSARVGRRRRPPSGSGDHPTGSPSPPAKRPSTPGCPWLDRHRAAADLPERIGTVGCGVVGLGADPT